MSNRIRCRVESNDYLTIDPLGSDQVVIEVYETGGSSCVHLNRDDFIDFLAENMYLTIIRNEEFPKVGRDGPRVTVDDLYFFGSEDPSELRREGLARLAVAEFLEANPPVDEEQVAAIAGLLSAEVGGNYQGLARRLYLAGVRVGGDDK